LRAGDGGDGGGCDEPWCRVTRMLDAGQRYQQHRGWDVNNGLLGREYLPAIPVLVDTGAFERDHGGHER